MPDARAPLASGMASRASARACTASIGRDLVRARCVFMRGAFIKDARVSNSYPLEENLGYLLNRCAALMAARFERELAEFDVTLAQWGALLAINGQANARPSDVAATVGIDRGAASRLIARMHAKGLIEREEDDADGRSVVLRLSGQTKAMMPELIDRSRRTNRDALALLDSGADRELLAKLSQLLERLSAQN